NIVMEDLILEGEKGITMIDVTNIELKNVKVLNEKGAAITIYNGHDITASQFAFDEKEGKPIVKVLGSLSENIKFVETDLSTSQVQRGEEVGKKAVKIK